MESSQPLVSVLMTAFNREKYIREAIDSVLSSSYKNFELIIVDDRSSDDTLAIAREYAARDGRIKVFQNEVNLGDYPNRNKAASYASGKYLKYVDSDDLIYPHSLELLVSSMEAFPDAALGIVSVYAQEEKPFPFALEPGESYRQHFFVEKRVLDIGPGGLIFRTDRFREVGGFTGKRYIGDIEINLRLAAKWPIVRITSALVYWRRHEGQEFAAGHNLSGYLELMLPLYKEELGKPECPLSEEDRQKVIQYYRKISASGVLSLAVKQRQWGRAVKLYRQLELSPADLLNAVFNRKKTLTDGQAHG